MTDQELLTKYAPAVEAFRLFCIQSGDDPAFEEINFYDLSIGFFIALGITGGDEPFDDARTLAVICRYRLQYWQPAARSAC